MVPYFSSGKPFPWIDFFGRDKDWWQGCWGVDDAGEEVLGGTTKTGDGAGSEEVGEGEFALLGSGLRGSGRRFRG